MPRLIGLAGLRTSGKDTTFELVREQLPNQRVDRAAFADNLKLLAARSLGMTERGYVSDEDLVVLMDTFKEIGVLHYGVKLPKRRWWSRDKTYLTEITGRQYLQYLGANARTVFGDSFWIDQVLPNPRVTSRWQESRDVDELLTASYPLSDVLCVTDVRYPNEALRIRHLGGEVWEIKRPGVETDGHSSEQALAQELIDVTIDNSGSVSDLAVTIKEALNV